MEERDLNVNIAVAEMARLNGASNIKPLSTESPLPLSNISSAGPAFGFSVSRTWSDSLTTHSLACPHLLQRERKKKKKASHQHRLQMSYSYSTEKTVRKTD